MTYWIFNIYYIFPYEKILENYRMHLVYIAFPPTCMGGRYSFPWYTPLTLDPYLIMPRVKQGGIEYHFLSLWYDSTWDWTQVSQTTFNTNVYANIYICIYIMRKKIWKSAVTREREREKFNSFVLKTWAAEGRQRDFWNRRNHLKSTLIYSSSRSRSKKKRFLFFSVTSPCSHAVIRVGHPLSRKTHDQDFTRDNMAKLRKCCEDFYPPSVNCNRIPLNRYFRFSTRFKTNECNSANKETTQWLFH